MLRLLIFATLLASASQACAACRVEQRTSLTIENVAGLVLVPLTVNGIAADFLLDTGAERTVVGIAAADRLHIARDEWVSTDILGAGGRDRRRLGRPSSLSLGGLALRRRTVAADNSVVIGPIPDQVAGRPIAGLLGEDFLSPFDLDIDIPGGKLTLYEVSGCSGRFLPQVAPWTGAYHAIPASRPVRNVLTVPLHIGKAAVEAILDSGAQTTVLTLPGMVQLGLAAGGGSTVRGFGPNSLAARTQSFTVQAGGTPATRMDVVIAPIRTMRSVGALLGADWMATRHIWISWATDTVFVASGPG